MNIQVVGKSAFVAVEAPDLAPAAHQLSMRLRRGFALMAVLFREKVYGVFPVF